jgi:beta-xylosidase
MKVQRTMITSTRRLRTALDDACRKCLIRCAAVATLKHVAGVVSLALAVSSAVASSQPSPGLPWLSDAGDGTFRNPVLHADYSDPDAVRVGSDYYLVSSSFSAVPGLPILHSRDLVNWQLVNHALARLVPEEVFSTPRHGAGVWAPAIRHHAGKYWIYYPDPDFGIYVTTAADPRGAWSRPALVKPGKGLIDPCPLWDDDGSVYLIHAFARSRAGFANVLHLNRLSTDGTRVIDAGRVVIDGNALTATPARPAYTTLEGPKIYKRNGWYYVFAPAGGVKQGWQSVFRSRRIEGPYDDRIVLAQGSTDINGPHQGALIDTPSGEWWFLHFQDAEAYGRVVHMQPVVWRDDWPVIGDDRDGDGRGEPRRSWKKPSLPAQPPTAPPSTDTFAGRRLGLQWQWQANPQAGWASFPRQGLLRLAAVPNEPNLWPAPNLLLQKFPAAEFAVHTVIDVTELRDGERAGLIVFGTDYAWIGAERAGNASRLVLRARTDAANGGTETVLAEQPLKTSTLTLRLDVTAAGQCRFNIGPPFIARPGRWVGAKVGLFAAAPPGSTRTGAISVRSFIVN